MYTLLSKYAYFGEFEQNTRKIRFTHQDTKNVHISEKIHGFSKKKICVSFSKNIHIREKFGDSTMEANFILKWDHGTKKCIFWSI